MERKTRRVKSLLNGSDLETLTNPIEKTIKPNQIYYDIPSKLVKTEGDYSLLKDNAYGYYNKKCCCSCHSCIT